MIMTAKLSNRFKSSITTISNIMVGNCSSFMYCRDARGDGITYFLELSERLGRTSSQEQYAYLYR